MWHPPTTPPPPSRVLHLQPPAPSLCPSPPHFFLSRLSAALLESHLLPLIPMNPFLPLAPLFHHRRWLPSQLHNVTHQNTRRRRCPHPRPRILRRYHSQRAPSSQCHGHDIRICTRDCSGVCSVGYEAVVETLSCFLLWVPLGRLVHLCRCCWRGYLLPTRRNHKAHLCTRRFPWVRSATWCCRG